MSKKEDYITHYNNYVWVNTKVYIKCPKCGKVALVDTGMVLTSYPPQYGWHCKYCNSGGSMFTDELYNAPYEQVTPSQEDKDLYEPPIKWSQESISINEEGATEESIATYTMDNTGAISIDGDGIVHGIENVGVISDMNKYRNCQICGKDFICGSIYSLGIGPDKEKYICDECANRLKKLLYGDEK